MVSFARVRHRDECWPFIVNSNDSMDGAETSGVCEHAAQSAMVEAGFAGATANVEASIWRDEGSAITCDGVVFIHRGEQCQSGQRTMERSTHVADVFILGRDWRERCVVAVQVYHRGQIRSECFFGSVVKTYCGMFRGRSL